MTQTPARLAHFVIDLPIIIRPIRSDDLPLLEWNEEMWRYRELFQQAYQDVLADRRMMLIADANGYPAGRLFVQLCAGNFHYADGLTRAYLYSLHVHPILQRRGIGTQLIDAAEAELVERGFLTATIAVAIENERARALYERLGYEVFRRDTSNWSYRDPDEQVHEVNEVCWALKKQLVDDDDYLEYL